MMNNFIAHYKSSVHVQEISRFASEFPENALAMCINVVTVPETKPMKPNRIRSTFLPIFHLQAPSSSGQATISSRMGGKMSAMALLDKAPIREMRRSRCGTVAAIPTERRKITGVELTVSEQCRADTAESKHMMETTRLILLSM